MLGSGGGGEGWAEVQVDLFLGVAFLLIQFIQIESHSDFKGVYNLGLRNRVVQS